MNNRSCLLSAQLKKYERKFKPFKILFDFYDTDSFGLGESSSSTPLATSRGASDK